MSRPGRVLLINPPSPERLGAPLLGLQYVAAALLARGHEVRVIDAAARYFDHDDGWIASEALAYGPDLIGMALFSRWVHHAYKLIPALKGTGAPLVAGGAHATVRSEECLRLGFDFAIEGEAERALPALVEALVAGDDLSQVQALRRLDDRGEVVSGPPATFIADLDELAAPWNAQHLFDPGGYDATGREVIPGGLLTSRGCPARCTFCANYVTGRGYRYRSAADVVGEVTAMYDRHQTVFFPFWDDALTANMKRLYRLCDALEALPHPIRFSAITRANMVTPELLDRLIAAGMVSINFGVESGDDTVLRAIKKGVSTDRVVRALEMAKGKGLTTAANFMLGFPMEGPRELSNTLAFMQRIAPMVDTFSTLGVVVPFPGTPIYEDYHREYGFTDWWLRPDYARYTPWPEYTQAEAFARHYTDDANLELDFFRYDDERRGLIREALRFKGEHNLRMMGLLHDPVFHADPPEWFSPEANR